jgi:integrase
MLTDTAIRKARKKARRYKLADGFGLYLAVMPSGKKVFRYEYRYHGRRETLTLGTYAEGKGEGMGLLEARAAHATARRKLEKNESPAQIHRRERQLAASKLTTTFQGVAETWLAEFSPRRSAEWSRQVVRWFKADVYPVIGDRPLAEIEKEEILTACRRAQDRGSQYTAECIRRYVAAVFEYANLRSITDRNPARAVRGVIAVPPTRELPALTAKELRELVKAIRAGAGRASTRIALELLLLTFTRKSELIRATWDEIDLEEAEWRVPAQRMKMREAHVVPLSTQAVALFKKQQPLASGSKFVFPSMASLLKPMSDTALNNALLRLGYGNFSPHGFRRTASTILNELGWRPDIIERQLAHRERNKVRAAYNKATFLPERRLMMQAWADHIATILAGGKVIPIGSKVVNTQTS